MPVAMQVSEGINFSDEYARGVVIIGIPFPNVSVRGGGYTNKWTAGALNYVCTRLPNQFETRA